MGSAVGKVGSALSMMSMLGMLARAGVCGQLAGGVGSWDAIVGVRDGRDQGPGTSRGSSS